MLKFTVGVNQPAFFWCLNNGFEPNYPPVAIDGDEIVPEEGTGIAEFALPPNVLEELLQNSL